MKSRDFLLLLLGASLGAGVVLLGFLSRAADPLPQQAEAADVKAQLEKLQEREKKLTSELEALRREVAHSDRPQATAKVQMSAAETREEKSAAQQAGVDRRVAIVQKFVELTPEQFLEIQGNSSASELLRWHEPPE